MNRKAQYSKIDITSKVLSYLPLANLDGHKRLSQLIQVVCAK